MPTKSILGEALEFLIEVDGMTGWFKEVRDKLPFHPNAVPYIASLTVMAFPVASIKQMVAIVIFLIWGFAIDDAHLLESTTTEKQPFWFKGNMREYLEATAEEAEIFREGNGQGKDTFGKFIEVRLKSGFFRFYQLMSEVAFGVEDYDDPLIDECKQSATMILMLTNDILSFNKEVLEEKNRARKLAEKRVQELIAQKKLYEQVFEEITLSEEFAPIGNSVFQYQREFKCSSKTDIDGVYEMLEREKISFDKLCQAISEIYDDLEST